MGKILKSFPIGLKIFDIQAMNIKRNHRLFLVFFAGIIIGTLMMNFLAGKYAGQIGIYSEYFIDGINNPDAKNFDKWAFNLFCIKKYALEAVVLIALNCTGFGMFVNYGYCIYKGIAISILISSATLTYGTGGILLYLMSIFPHYFTYVPMVVFTLYFGIKIKENIKKKRVLVSVLKGLAIEAAFVVCTAFLEAYVNYPFVRSMFSR